MARENRQLSLDAAHLEAILQSSQDAIFRTDLAGQILTWSPGAEGMYGYAAQEALFRPLSGLISPERTGEVERMLGKAAHRAEVQRFESVHLRKDGTQIPASVTVAPIIDDAGRTTYASWIVRNVTEQRSLQNQLRQSQKKEAIGKLTGGVAHDFNNLLTIINGYSEMLLSHKGNILNVRNEIEQVRDAAEHATTLARQLLALSRHASGPTEILGVSEVIQNLGTLLKRLIGEDIEFVSRPAPGTGHVCVERAHLEQVVLNLVVNARDAMPNGGKLVLETANVELDPAYSARHAGVGAGSHVMIAISDTGTGMDRMTQAKIFEPFFTTKQPGKGTGLGLSIVFGIVQQAGGDIAVYSEPGIGTTVQIYLPRAFPAAPATFVEGTSGVSEQRTVLVVDQEPGIRRFVTQTLRASGYRVVEASNPTDALGRANEVAPDVVLTDVEVESSGGVEFVERLMKTCPSAKVLYTSGYGHRAASETGTTAAFLPKPFSAVLLLQWIREVLLSGERS